MVGLMIFMICVTPQKFGLEYEISFQNLIKNYLTSDYYCSIIHIESKERTN